MKRWRIRIWERPLEFCVWAETSVQAEQKAMLSQGLEQMDVVKITVKEVKEDD